MGLKLSTSPTASPLVRIKGVEAYNYDVQPVSFTTENQPQKYRKKDKKAVLLQGNRAMPQLLFPVYSSPTTFTTSLSVAKLRKPGFRAPNIAA